MLGFFFIFVDMRGENSIYGDLFSAQGASGEVANPKQQRPRNYYQPERNKALVYRYYFHAELGRKRYDDCLHELEKEFYLTIPRLIVLLSECNAMLREVIAAKPTIKELEIMFPHLNWRSSRMVVIR